jgi:NAD(P)H-flavin reductase
MTSPSLKWNTAGQNLDCLNKLLVPQWAKIVKVIPEASGISTYHLRFIDPVMKKQYTYLPGQFNMLYLPGYGEAAISLSSDPESTQGQIVHTVRHVGNVTKAISGLTVGDVIGVRGPFGTSWPLEQLRGMDIVIACGGIGLPPLRGVIYHIIRHRSDYAKVTLLYGARTPADLMYPNEYDAWKKADIDVQVTVDRGDEQWKGRVGVVPMWFYHFRVDPRKTAVLTCGPEIMMRFVIYEALARRIPTDQIFISLERNMKCGQGACGHCQQGPFFICKDGPVFPFSVLESIFNIEEY